MENQIMTEKQLNEVVIKSSIFYAHGYDLKYCYHYLVLYYIERDLQAVDIITLSLDNVIRALNDKGIWATKGSLKSISKGKVWRFTYNKQVFFVYKRSKYVLNEFQKKYLK